MEEIIRILKMQHNMTDEAALEYARQLLAGRAGRDVEFKPYMAADRFTYAPRSNVPVASAVPAALTLPTRSAIYGDKIKDDDRLFAEWQWMAEQLAAENPAIVKTPPKVK